MDQTHDDDDDRTRGPLEQLGMISSDIFGEVERFAAIYGRTNDGLMIALRKLANAKSTLEMIEAELDLTIRKSAEITGEKTTEKKIESGVRANGKWRAAKADYDAAEEAVEHARHALKTLDKKDRMLELLARAQMREFGVLHRTQ